MLRTQFASLRRKIETRASPAGVLRLAADLLNDDSFPSALREIGPRYDWAPRRLNAAVAFLKGRRLVRVSEAVGTQPWLTSWIQKTDTTRRYVKSRSTSCDPEIDSLGARIVVCGIDLIYSNFHR